MDEVQRHKLIERYMPAAALTAKEMDDGRIPFEDLLQEAYLGILHAFAETEEEPAGEVVQESVRRQILRAYEEHELAEASDREIIAQMEALSESIDRLTELYGEKPNVDELANDLGVTQERVIEWLLLSGEELPENASWFAEAEAETEVDLSSPEDSIELRQIDLIRGKRKKPRKE